MTMLTPRGTPLSRFLSDGWVTTKRNLLKIKRVPDILVFTLIQPIMFVLLFTYVYGGVIDIPGSSYAEFLMAGICAGKSTSTLRYHIYYAKPNLSYSNRINCFMYSKLATKWFVSVC